jgi:hypothetical protein
MKIGRFLEDFRLSVEIWHNELNPHFEEFSKDLAENRLRVSPSPQLPDALAIEDYRYKSPSRLTLSVNSSTDQDN